MRYVDDFFAADRFVLSSSAACVIVGFARPEVIEHAMNCVARLIRLVLGSDAVAESKLECGMKLTVLGIEISTSEIGYRFRPSPAKVLKWTKLINQYLHKQTLEAGEASKLAGRLSWAAASVFNRIGRATLRPIIDQQKRRDGWVSSELERSLRWWLEVLKCGLAETKYWQQANERTMHLFCDASGRQGLGAVLLAGDIRLCTRMLPSATLLQHFRPRGDNQIMGLELMAISLGLTTFEKWIRNSNLVVWCDNCGSEMALRRGSARSYDHAQMVHAQWTFIAKAGIAVHVQRIASDDNIADLPSRGDLRWIASRGVIEVEPKLAEVFECSEAWRELTERWSAFGQHAHVALPRQCGLKSSSACLCCARL